MGGDRSKLGFACGSVIPGCDAVFEASSEDGILEQVGEHARNAHGVDEVTPELADRVRSEIKPAD